jgi:hypothetical protein
MTKDAGLEGAYPAASAQPGPSLPQRTTEQIIADATQAQRLHIKRWRDAREAASQEVKQPVQRDITELLQESNNLADLRAVRSSGARAAMRYLPDAAVSSDDLNTNLAILAEPGGWLHGVPEAERAGAFIEDMLTSSSQKFLRKGGALSPHNQKSVRRWLTSRMVNERIKTAARNHLAQIQEAKVRDMVERLGFHPRTQTGAITGLDDLPVGYFTPRETKVRDGKSNSKADCVIRPCAGHAVVIECKSSSSDVNSVKRLIKEVGQKSATWSRALGPNTVTVAVIGGVFKPEDIETAQRDGIIVVFDHDLSWLQTYLEQLLAGAGDDRLIGEGGQCALFAE